ncbi:MAG TPA: phosphoglycerate mutase, partial [Giesbergeria sp.]|nr:phosphoglycerate mutase [Giesbergeria sp.]
MPDTPHLIIPYAAHPSDACRQALQNLRLPHLDALLQRLTLQDNTQSPDDALSAPHERAQARALGLPDGDGRTPWAAWELHQRGRTQDALHSAWAFVTPCHWHVRTDHVTLSDPAALRLDEAASRALLEVLAPWFAQDGVTLHYDRPTRWLAQGDTLADLATASVERVLHRDVSHWLPGEHKAHPLRRLHSEMQMLLYTH